MKTSCLKKIIFTLLLFFVFHFGTCSESSSSTPNELRNKTFKSITTSDADGILPVRKIWKDQEKVLKSLVNSMIKRGMPTVLRQVYSRNISSPCLSTLLQLTTGLKQLKLWAFKMVDASGKLPIGILSGTLSALGNYEECLSIDVDQPRAKVKGQYCSVRITPPLPKWRPHLSIHVPFPELKNISAPDTVITFLSNLLHNLYSVPIKMGLCIPSSCSMEDVNKLVQILPEFMNITWKFNVHECETKESFQFSSLQITIIYCFVSIMVIIAVGTAIDIILKKKSIEARNISGRICQVLQCFSVKINMKAISAFVTPVEHLRFIHGFNTIMMLWILVANAFMYINFETTANFLDALRITRDVFYEIMINRIPPMQGIIFMCGFAATYKWMRSPDNRFCAWKCMLKAYWRYTPTYMFLIALIMLTPGWGSGPSWNSYMASTYSNCKNHGWTNLLYINNYVNHDEMCLESGWFFAVLAQLHVIGLVILIPLKSRPKTSLLLNLFLAISSLLAVFLTNLYYNVQPNEMVTYLGRRDRINYATRTYHRIYSHMVFYCSGIFVGYFTATRPNIRISSKVSWMLWISTSVGALATVCVVHLWSDGNLPSPYISASYDTVGKVLWAAFLSWATISLVIQRSGGFYDILSWRPFAFFDRLMFIVFVINPCIVTMIFGFKRTHMFLSDFEVYYTSASLILCNYVPAYAIHIGIESPLLNLTALFKKMCGFKTSKTIASDSETPNGIQHFEGVLTEKVPRQDVRNSNKEGKLQKKCADKTTC